MLGLFVLVRKVRDVWEWLNCMHVDTSEGGAVMSQLLLRAELICPSWMHQVFMCLWSMCELRP